MNAQTPHPQNLPNYLSGQWGVNLDGPNHSLPGIANDKPSLGMVNIISAWWLTYPTEKYES